MNTAIAGSSAKTSSCLPHSRRKRTTWGLSGRGSNRNSSTTAFTKRSTCSGHPAADQGGRFLTAVPAGIGDFTSFGSVAIDPGTVVFEGFSSDGAGGTRNGLYTDFGGTLAKLIATGDDSAERRERSALRFRGFNNHQAVFAVDFATARTPSS